MGSPVAGRVAGQIIGSVLVDALQPSIDAMSRLAAQNRSR